MATIGQVELEKRLSELAQSHGVPGAQAAVLDGDEVTQAATGVLNLRTGVPVTPESLFLPGSIGKSYTATVVMGLVEEGKLELDAPVVTYIPEFRVADQDVSRSVTIRQLLAHTTGFDGDHFEDTGRGDDCLERYVASCPELEQVSPPGKLWSYCNTGYSVLGRIVEVCTGKVWEGALRERLIAPLGLEQTVLFPEEALLHSTAVGHVNDPENMKELMVTPQFGLPRATGPMGATLIASAADVVGFAGLHIRGGTSPDGTRLLKEETVARMQEPEIDLVDRSLLGSDWGLGWILDEWDGIRIIGHDGNSLGQNAFLRIAPDHGFAVCLQTNVTSVIGMFRELFSWLFTERLGVAPPPMPVPAKGKLNLDPADYVGTYRRIGLEQVVKEADDGGLTIDMIPLNPEMASMPPMKDLPLKPVDDREFLLKLPIADMDFPLVFFNPDQKDGRPTYIHFGGRAARRT